MMYSTLDSSDREAGIESLAEEIYDMTAIELHYRLCRLSRKHSICADALRAFEKAMDDAACVIYDFEKQR